MSTRPVAPVEIPEGWEKVNPTVNRMTVPGGWLYEMYGRNVVFVPEPMPAPNAAARRWREWDAMERPSLAPSSSPEPQQRQ
jgi:hypothetical protein